MLGVGVWVVWGLEMRDVFFCAWLLVVLVFFRVLVGFVGVFEGLGGSMGDCVTGVLVFVDERVTRFVGCGAEEDSLTLRFLEGMLCWSYACDFELLRAADEWFPL